MLSLTSYAYYFAVEFEALLVAELGRFGNGDPAVCVIPPDAPQRGQGLHIYIDEFANKLSNTIYQQRVSLVQFDRSQAGVDKLRSALLKLQDRYPSARPIPLPYRKEATLEISFLIPITRTNLGSAIPLFLPR